MKKTCPLNGEQECDGCKFYSRDFTTDYVCVFTSIAKHLNELCHQQKIMVGSVEQQRELHTQFYRSGMTGEPSKELLQYTGLTENKDAAN